MNKSIVLSLLILFVAVDAFPQESGIRAEVNIYSGRAPPKWDMTPMEVAILLDRLATLEETNPVDIPEWGFVQVTNDEPGEDFPYRRICVFDGIVAVDNGTGVKYYADSRGIMEYMTQLGDEHDPYLRPGTTLPPGTPHIAIIQDAVTGTFTLGEDAKTRITIFSEGTAPLAVSIEAPEFLKPEAEEITIPAGGGKDIFFVIDTASAGPRSGEIIVSSDDPSNGEVRIPVKITVLDGGDEVTDTPEGGLDPLFLVPVIVLFCIVIIAGFIIRKRRNERRIEREREEFLKWKEERTDD